LPNFGPGGFNFFGITVGRDISITGSDKLEDHVKTTDKAGQLEKIANEEKKTGARLGVNKIRVIERRSDTTE